MKGRVESGSSGTIADRSLFQPFLAPGEKVIWSGRPRRLRWFGADNWHWLISAFAVVWLLPCGTATLMIWRGMTRRGWEATLDHEGPLFVLFVSSALFLAIIIGLICWRTARLRRTAYALTDRRALKVEHRDKLRSTSTALDLVNRFEPRVRRDGGGDLVFGYRREYVNNSEGGGSWVEKPRLTFEDISDVPKVLSLAQEALAKLGYQPVS